MAATPGNQRRLGAQAVDGVHHIIQLGGQQLAHRVRLDELIHPVNHQLRIDLQQALGHGVHLGHAQRVAQRMRLAVDIGRGDMVQINQRQLANRAARQRLGRPRADAAHANHADMRMAKARQRRLAIQPANAAKAARPIVGRRQRLAHHTPYWSR